MGMSDNSNPIQNPGSITQAQEASNQDETLGERDEGLQVVCLLGGNNTRRATKSLVRWEHPSHPGDIQWMSLEHNGVMFPPAYEPHSMSLLKVFDS